MPEAPTAVILLATGSQAQMRSATAKALHSIGGRSLLGHAVAAAQELNPGRVALVLGPEQDAVAEHAHQLDPEILVVTCDDDRSGEGAALDALSEAGALGAPGAQPGPPASGAVVVLAADAPLLDGATLAELLTAHHGGEVTVLSTLVADRNGPARLSRDPATGLVAAVAGVDSGECAGGGCEPGKFEVCAPGYVCEAELLRRSCAARGEGISALVAFAQDQGTQVRAVKCEDPWVAVRCSDREQLQALGAELNRRTLVKWLLAGVTIVDLVNTWIDLDVELEPDVTLQPGVQLFGKCRVASGAQVGPDCTLRDVVIGEGAKVERTHGSESTIGPHANVGPFSFLRPGTVLGERGKVGAYCEVKNSQIGAGSKVPHLSYVGDTEIGEDTNVGAASVTLNYDSVHKHRTKIGSHVRIGGDTMMVAPVEIGDGAFTAAGSVITQDVPPGALGVGRSRQTNKRGWVAATWPGSKSATAAAAALAAEPEHAAAPELSAEPAPSDLAPPTQDAPASEAR